MVSNDMTPAICFQYCLGKGLDLFGVLMLGQPQECRCGASKLNHAIWGDNFSDQLAIPLADLESTHLAECLPDANTCNLCVYRYKGHFASFGVPWGYMHETSQ